MSLAFRQIKVYVKLCSLIAALLFAVVVIVGNSGPTASVWFFGPRGEVPVWLLILCTAVVTLVLWLLIRPAFSVYRDMTELRKTQLDRDQQKRQKELLDRLDKKESSPAAPAQSAGKDDAPDGDETDPV